MASPTDTTRKVSPEKMEPGEDYTTPVEYELQKMLNQGPGVAYGHVNEVWPSVYIGDEMIARNRYVLQKMGITHILNAAEGTHNSVDTGADYYSEMNIDYYGVEACDVPTFDLSVYFDQAGQFIDHALSKPENKLLVHCVMGRSRSATLFIAYLMIYKHLTLVDAIEHVKRHRRILPNWGFLKQLRLLDIQLQEDKNRTEEAAEEVEHKER